MAIVKGRGFASVNYPTGMNLGGDPTQALIHCTTLGDFVITLSSVDLGQGIKTVGAQIGWQRKNWKLTRPILKPTDAETFTWLERRLALFR